MHFTLDIDLKHHEPTFARDGPVSERQAKYLERVGIDSSVVTVQEWQACLLINLPLHKMKD